MTCDVQQLLRRQAQWQKSRQALPWPEKIRMAERIRESILALRATRTKEVPEKPRHHLPSASQREMRTGQQQ